MKGTCVFAAKNFAGGKAFLRDKTNRLIGDQIESNRKQWVRTEHGLRNKICDMHRDWKKCEVSSIGQSMTP
jgi:hypothetical protein